MVWFCNKNPNSLWSGYIIEYLYVSFFIIMMWFYCSIFGGVFLRLWRINIRIDVFVWMILFSAGCYTCFINAFSLLYSIINNYDSLYGTVILCIQIVLWLCKCWQKKRFCSTKWDQPDSWAFLNPDSNIYIVTK